MASIAAAAWLDHSVRSIWGSSAEDAPVVEAPEPVVHSKAETKATAAKKPTAAAESTKAVQIPVEEVEPQSALMIAANVAIAAVQAFILFVAFAVPIIIKGLQFGFENIAVPSAQFAADVVIPAAQDAAVQGATQLQPVIKQAIEQSAPVVQPIVGAAQDAISKEVTGVSSTVGLAIDTTKTAVQSTVSTAVSTSLQTLQPAIQQADALKQQASFAADQATQAAQQAAQVVSPAVPVVKIIFGFTVGAYLVTRQSLCCLGRGPRMHEFLQWTTSEKCSCTDRLRCTQISVLSLPSSTFSMYVKWPTDWKSTDQYLLACARDTPLRGQ
jgi:hypothetical protein